MRYWLYFFMSVIALPVLFLTLGNLLVARSSSQVEAKAPNFSLETLEGDDFTLSEHKGKVILLNFWGTWCPECIAEMHSLDRLFKTFNGQDFMVLTVNIDPDSVSARRFIGKNDYSFPVLLDPKSRVRNLYGVFRIPATILIDGNGNIIEHYLGGRDWTSDEILKKIKSTIHN